MKAIIVTNCTNRKRVGSGKTIEAPSRGANESVEAYANRWIEHARKHTSQVIPENLYCGRGYGEAINAARKLDADIYTISAGFGLLQHDHSIPPYNFTFAELAKFNEPPQDWWKAINKARQTQDLLTERLMDDSLDLALMSISSSYLELIEHELLSLPEEALRKVRLIIGYKPPPSLEANAILYDSRLDGPDSSIRGTRADFNSRALHHFVENVVLKTNNHSITNHRALANALLAPMGTPHTPKRQKATDEEIIVLIRMHWHESGGRSGVSLRLLRDKAGVACEQGRFAELFRQVVAAS
jgi:hypothetical protein